MYRLIDFSGLVVRIHNRFLSIFRPTFNFSVIDTSKTKVNRVMIDTTASRLF